MKLHVHECLIAQVDVHSTDRILVKGMMNNIKIMTKNRTRFGTGRKVYVQKVFIFHSAFRPRPIYISFFIYI